MTRRKIASLIPQSRNYFNLRFKIIWYLRPHLCTSIIRSYRGSIQAASGCVTRNSASLALSSPHTASLLPLQNPWPLPPSSPTSPSSTWEQGTMTTEALGHGFSEGEADTDLTHKVLAAPDPALCFFHVTRETISLQLCLLSSTQTVLDGSRAAAALCGQS